MTNPRPQLRLVDSSTGEIVEDERDILIEQLESEKRGQAIKIGKLKSEIRELRAVEPEHQDIREVLIYCNETWKRRFHIVVGENWEKIRARLRDRIEERDNKPFTVDELKLAADGALLDNWTSGRKLKDPGFLTPKRVFASPESVGHHRDLALGFKAKAGLGVGDLLQVADELLVVDWKFILRVCECGHRRVAHHRPAPKEGCLMCDCEDFYLDPFDSFNMRADSRLARWAE